MILVLVIAGVLLAAHTAPFPFVLDWIASRHVMWRAPAIDGRPTIYLTYDDGPNPTATAGLLDVLARERVRATFFLIERHVTEATVPLVRRMFAEGHGVALHTHTRSLLNLSPDEMATWLDGTAGRIEALAGDRPCRAFRPHGGWRNAAMIEGVARANYQLVGWGWNAWDWNWFRRRTADSVVDRLGSRAADGLIAVIHDGHHEDPRADRTYAIDATARLVPILRQKGFAFGTICDAVARAESAASAGTATSR
jgi:chitooligosaccharide deacetylase